MAEIGRQLYEAERRCRPLPPLTQANEGLTTAEAYRIQEEYARLRLATGARLVGHKIGCTSQAVQELFGIDSPDFGRIFDDMVLANGGDVACALLIEPMVEPELAFLLAHDLSGPGVTSEQVLAATLGIAPCLEIIDSRVVEWDITLVDTIADNGSSARCVLGRTIGDFRGRDLRDVRVHFARNGEEIDTATGAAVLGHPASAVAWLANTLHEFGETLCAGQFVLSGSFTKAVRVKPGESFRADFGEFGSVKCDFV